MNADSGSTVPDRWDRLSTAFEQVLSHPAAARASAVREICGADTQLRTELESLLTAHDGAPAFLDALYAEVIAPGLFRAGVDGASGDDLTGDGRPPAVEPGTRVRHFVVQERLGSGGSGVVHRGHDTMLQRDVAMKFLSPHLHRDPAARERLITEARAASRLEHPHVCPIHTVEVLADGGVCLVMGYCAGGTLRDRLQRGMVPTADLLRIARDIASGLAAAHGAGIVHGDIKPANIGFGDGDVARLLDFGVAAPADADALPMRELTGTLPYLAPEFWRGGAAGRRGPRTDVWAFGVTLVELITGKRPFAAEDPAALAQQIRAARLPVLRRPDGSDIPLAVAHLVHDMVSVDPTIRPPTGAAVLTRLEAAAKAMPRGPTPPAAQRRRLVAVIGAGAAIVAGLLFVQRSGQRSARPVPAVEVARSAVPLPSIAVLPFATRGSPAIAYLTHGMVDMLTPALDATGLVHGVDPGAIISASGDGAPDSAAARRIADAVRAERYVMGSVVQAGATLTVRATLHERQGREVGRTQIVIPNSDGLATATDALVRQLLATTLLAPGDTIASVAAATTSSSRAWRAYLDGEREFRDARPAAAMARFQAAVTADSTFALAWFRLARAARWSDVDSLSAAAAQRALTLAGSLPPRQQTLVRAAHALRVGSPVLAERLLRQLVADYPTDVDAWMLLGEALFTNNPYYGRPIAESAPAFERVMALDMRHRDVTVYLMDLAAQARRAGQLDTLFRMYFRPNSAGEQPGIRAAYSALHARRVPRAVTPSGWPTPLDDPTLARVALQRISPVRSDRAAARAYATVMTNAAATQLDGALALAALEVADSSWARAAVHLRMAHTLQPSAAAEHRALLALAPTVTLPADTLRTVRRELLEHSLSGPVTAVDLSRAERGDLRQYLIGLLSVALDDSLGVTTARDALAMHRAGPSRLALPLMASLAGHWHARRGRPDAALLEFTRAIPEVPATLRLRYPALAQPVDRLVRATLLERLGRRDEAARWTASLEETPGVHAAAFLRP
jgi:TolB-like protein